MYTTVLYYTVLVSRKLKPRFCSLQQNLNSLLNADNFAQDQVN